VAVDGARGAVVRTKSGNARDHLAGRRRSTLPAAASTVLDVIVEIGAMTAATALASGAADVASARSADAAGVVVERPTDPETLRLLRLIVAFAEGQTRVCVAGPGGLQSQRAQHGAGEYRPQPAQ
jgi:hypothetical protein